MVVTHSDKTGISKLGWSQVPSPQTERGSGVERSRWKGWVGVGVGVDVGLGLGLGRIQ